MEAMEAKLILDTDRPDASALEAMRERGGTWAAYQNHDMGHRDLGGLAFLKIGPGCTNVTAPKHYPDGTSVGMGWRYLFAGYVNLETGAIDAAAREGA